MDEQHSLERKRMKKKIKQYPHEAKLEISSDQTVSEERMGGNDNPRKQCTICKKEFANGKALGGHMRVHAQESSSRRSINGGGHDSALFAGEGSGHKNSPNYELQSSETEPETPICHVCNKSFYSWKSLYGHMRCHSGRGIPVPLSESEHDPARNGPRRCIDLLSKIAGWPVTGKRGRASSSSSPSPTPAPPAPALDILEAAQNLLLLSAGPRLQPYFYGSSDCRAGDVTGFCYEKIRVSIEDSKNAVKEKKKRGRKKKLKLETKESPNDPIPTGAPEPTQGLRLADPAPIEVPGGGFRCVTCKKEFSTYQALGGHRSKHYWEKNADDGCFCYPGQGGPTGPTGPEYCAGQEGYCLWGVAAWESGQTGRVGPGVDAEQHKDD